MPRSVSKGRPLIFAATRRPAQARLIAFPRFRITWLLTIFFSIWLNLFSTSVIAQDQIASRSFFADPTSLATYDDIKLQPFSPYTNVFNGGYYHGAFWIKLDLPARSEELVLRVKPPYIDNIDVYAQGQLLYSVRNGGYSITSQSQSELPALPYVFVIPPADQDRAVYLRFKSVHSYQIQIEALPLPQFIKKDGVEKLIYTGYTTLSLTLALWLLIIWLLDRNMVVGVFAIQQCLGFMHTFITAGFAQFFFGETPATASTIDFSGALLFVTYPLAGLIANKLLLRELGLSRRYAIVTNGLIGTSLLLITMFLLGDLDILKWNATLVLAMMIYFWLAALFGLSHMSPIDAAERFLRRSVRIYYSVNLIIWIIALLPLFGIWNFGEIALQSLFAYNVLSGLMLFYLLQCRYKFRLESELLIKNELKFQAELEKKEREELGMMMAMLSHEIKTPLSVLKLVVDDRVKGSELEGHANRAISNINFVINRCLQLGKLDSETIRIDASTFNVCHAIQTLIQDFGTTAAARVKLTGDARLACTTDLNIFRVLLSNLIDNALKYSPGDSSVKIRFFYSKQAHQSGLILLVSNRMGPLGQPDTSQVFKKYYRNMAATKIAGSGLGLFLISRLVTILGGNVYYRPRNGHVVFVLRIPE